MTTRIERVDLTEPARVLTALSTLGDLALRPVVGVPPSTSLADTSAAMERAGVSSLLVDGDGIVTERDIARACAHGVDPAASVEVIATWHPMAVPRSMSIVDATALMLNEHVRHLIVVTDEGPAIVSLRDLAAVLLQAANPHLWLTSLRVAVDAPEIWLG